MSKFENYISEYSEIKRLIDYNRNLSLLEQDNNFITDVSEKINDLSINEKKEYTHYLFSLYESINDEKKIITEAAVEDIFSKIETSDEEEDGYTWVNTLLDVVGIVDPTGIADATNAFLYFRKGEVLYGILSLISVVPYVGDAIAKPFIGLVKTGGALLKPITNILKTIFKGVSGAKYTKLDKDMVNKINDLKKGSGLSKELGEKLSELFIAFKENPTLRKFMDKIIKTTKKTPFTRSLSDDIKKLFNFGEEVGKEIKYGVKYAKEKAKEKVAKSVVGKVFKHGKKEFTSGDPMFFKVNRENAIKGRFTGLDDQGRVIFRIEDDIAKPEFKKFVSDFKTKTGIDLLTQKTKSFKIPEKYFNKIDDFGVATIFKYKTKLAAKVSKDELTKIQKFMGKLSDIHRSAWVRIFDVIPYNKVRSRELSKFLAKSRIYHKYLIGPFADWLGFDEEKITGMSKSEIRKKLIDFLATEEGNKVITSLPTTELDILEKIISATD